MKVFYFDFAYKDGHINFDSKIINAIANSNVVEYICPDGWYEGYDLKAKRVAGAIKLKGLASGKIELLYAVLGNISAAVKVAKYGSYELIVVGECELFALPVFLNLLGKEYSNRIVVIHHQDLDSTRGSRLINRIRKHVFKHYKDSYIHCIIEPFMRKSLREEYGVHDDKIICWRHPLTLYPEKAYDEKAYDCVGLSHSNNDETIRRLVDKEMQIGLLRKENLHVLLRSKNIEYDDGFLTITSEWFSKNRYLELLKSSRTVFVPLPEYFHDRISGLVYDACSLRIPVLSSEVPFVRYCMEEYPGIVGIYDEDRFAEQIRDMRNNDAGDSFERFIRDHRLDTLCKTIDADLEAVDA